MKPTPTDARKLILKGQRDPTWWTKNILGVEPWSKQIEIMESVRDNPRTAVRSCHGIGKSFVSGQIILWFLYNHPNAIVLSTAPTWRQVEKLVWKEVRASYKRAKMPLGGRILPTSPTIQVVQDEWYAAGLSTNDPNRFQGFHEKYILVVVDEAAGVPEDIFEAVEGVLTSEHARLLLLGNPTALSGTFYKAFRNPGWNTIAISAFDTPNFTEFGITEQDVADGTWESKITGPLFNPKLITPAWVADKHVQWGPDSPAYHARVKGQFPAEAEDTLIPLNWIEMAMSRWHEMSDDAVPNELGVDVARYGSDKTVVANRRGLKVMPLNVYVKQDTMETVGRVIHEFREVLAESIKVDVIGYGAGVVDRLAELGYPVFGINVAEASREKLDSDNTDPDKSKLRFVNLRSELWWMMRDLLNPDPRVNPHPIGLPPDDELMADLCGIKYKFTSKGQIKVEEKEETKKRIGRSPDRADAVILSFAPVYMAPIDAVYNDSAF
ncbi:hypothetical protein H1S01_03295 [Heliobacterium chlorum]|uniref:Uncharacterized protein n=2 Tax=Heliobacterium chlorum TaxID=2698 RepID=A0ABR7T027_HELCL|nr:hypothetical protein [Heliobacterium chlorum]